MAGTMRLLVMNGQKITQQKNGTNWEDQQVDKAGEIKPGIYNLNSNREAAENNSIYSGVILHVDEISIYQQHGKSIVRHKKGIVRGRALEGNTVNISYENGAASVVRATESSRKKGRRL